MDAHTRAPEGLQLPGWHISLDDQKIQVVRQSHVKGCGGPEFLRRRRHGNRAARPDQSLLKFSVLKNKGPNARLIRDSAAP